MKVIILNGSPKAEGNTATALHEVERTLNQQGIETEWIHVGNKQIHGCIACGTDPGEVTQDLEGMQTMRQLGLNMAFMIKSFKLGMSTLGSPKIKEELTETHYIR